MPEMVWLRSDLRTRDNSALAAACARASDGVAALFIIAPDQWRGHDYAPVRVEIILRTLRELSASLASLNIPLLIEHAPRPGDIPSIVRNAALRVRAAAVHANREHEVDEARRDERTARELESAGLSLRLYSDQTAIDPASIRTREGRFYSVFSPFRKAWLARWRDLGGAPLHPAPGKQKPLEIAPSPIPDCVPGFTSGIDPALWPGGEAWAHRRLKAFAAGAIASYKSGRDYPALDATSTLSVPLAVGALSTRQCIHAAFAAAALAPADLDPRSFEKMPAGPQCWLSEVVWREFFTHVLVGWPRVGMNRAFQPATERLRWSADRAAFDAWRAGRTGIPIVDAGMRQLAATGWMHNRIRMVAAMFLTKNLFIDWRWGERWFIQNLADGFFASNNGGWQWSASTGVDAAPYFRIFNPVSQSLKFDPAGAYIRRWVPELAGIEGDAVHQPHDAKNGLPALRLASLDYPPPIVDLSASRDAAIRAFQALRA